jgi:hypothetical protein
MILGSGPAEARAPESVADAAVVDDRFASVEAAVVAAVAAVAQRSVREDREYMGGIFALAEGGFRYSVAPGRRGHDRISVRIRIPQGQRLVALWHTHGAPHFSRAYFSDLDTALANAQRLPLYLGRPNGKVWVYRPGEATLSPREARRLGLDARPGYARGTPARKTG